ncbi:MAG: DNA primase, partial [Myxococcota bacterium]
MIPESVIEAVKDRVDIVQVVGRHVALKRVGRAYVGLCPFHTEKSPSFNVSPDRRGYHCFGCGEGGNVLRFLCKVQNRSFPEVVRELAKEYGIPIPEAPESPEDRARDALRNRLFALNERVVTFFREQLSADTGEEARKYLEERGLNPGVCAEFEVGFGGPGWDGLWQALGKTDQEREDLLTLGLCVKGDNNVYDRFRGRVIFPIRDEKLRVVGFGGRVFGERAKKEGVAKYLNNSESPIYEKSQVFYRLPQALTRIRRGEAAVIVEGYFDAIALERCGLAAMATCGTALTPRHAHHLQRLKAEVVLCWDGDAAGDRAVRKAGEVLLPLGITTRVASLPIGDDPDTYVARTGLTGASRLVKEAEPLPKFVIQAAARAAEDAGDDIPRRVAAIRSLAWLFHAIPAGLEKDLYLDLAAKKLGLTQEQLQREFREAGHRPVVHAPAVHQAAPVPAPAQNLP